MTLRRRVVLIVTGILLFIALGPLIVLLAQGYGYDFKNGHITITGTLVIKTEPRDAEVLLNGEPEGETPMVRRFLAQNEYLVEITKPGYRPWRKRINVFERQVTFLPDQNAKINLLLEENESIKSVVGVADTFAYENILFYIDAEGKEIYSSGFNSANPQLVASTTGTLSNPIFIEARRIGSGTEFVVRADQGLFYISGDQQIALPNLTSIQFGADAGQVLGLGTKNQLLEITQAGVKILQNDVFAFRRSENQIYYLTKDINGEHWLGRRSSRAETEKVIGTASFQKAQIILSPDNQIFLLLDGELYSVKDRLEKINSQIEFAYWDTNGGFLLYGNNHEAWVYQPLASESNELLIRAAIPTMVPIFHKAAGYTFIVEGKEIKAIEAGASGQPNVYSLFEALDPKKISLNEEGNIMVLLDGETLRMILIR